MVWQHGDPVTGSIQQTLKSGELAIYVAPRSRRELEPLGGLVPTSDPYYSEEINSPEYNYGGDIFRPEFGCTLPETGQPAPCSLAAHLMNYIGRVNRAFDPGYNQPARAGRTIPDFIRADNRRDDEFERIPGLRRVEQLPRGYEYYINVWVVDNSVAAQGQTQQDDPNKRVPMKPIMSESKTFLSWNVSVG